MQNTSLGLDLGPNSIGWALIDNDNKAIIDLGVRIFPEGVDNFDTQKEKPRNEDRRLARSMRRQIRRRAVRRRNLRKTLIELGLFPADANEQQNLYNLNPYELRVRALVEKISLHELGRILLHLNQRRGFLSNRKKDRDDTEVKGMLAEMGELEKTLGDQTLAQHLYQQQTENPLTQLRGIHTQRRWLTQEFDRIWTSQATHHKQLTSELAYGKLGKQKGIDRPIPKSRHDRQGDSNLKSFGLFGLIFFHRTLKPVPKEIIGSCELEPKQKRCHRADRSAQRFRLIMEVNNLRLIDDTASPPLERPLNDQERALVIDNLTATNDATFDQMRKWIGKLPDSPAPEQIRFNLEEGKRKKLQGMVTDSIMAAEGQKNKAVGKAWHKLDEKIKDDIVRALIDSVDDDETHEQLVNQFGLTPDQADGALSVDLIDGPTKGYVNFSRVAIHKLLPFLEKGMRLMANDETDSAMHAAGYMRPDQLQRRIFDQLPDPTRVSNAPIGDIPNPVVKRAIVELRKVVNSILREQRQSRNDPDWKPDAVHVEMARQVRQSPKQRSEYNSRTRDIEADRDKAKTFLNTHGQRYGSQGSNILKVQLWEQQNHDCPYCGQKIGQEQLFKDGLVNVDHILPYSRTLDDSQMNKVVCHQQCNQEKSNDATPYEWLAARDPDRYKSMCQIAFSMVRKGSMPYRKYKRFTQVKLELDDFIARQLTATGYIAKATVEYLKCLFENEHSVLGLKGQLTAELRRQWGLNNILRDDDLDIKSRDDHRHHAVDAVIIAMTNRSRLNQLTRIRKSGGVAQTGESLEYPWESFREDVVQKINNINISHRVERKVAGALHQDTAYGPVYDADRQRVQGRFVVRKPLEALSASEVEKIRDQTIRQIITKRLAEHGIEVGRGKKIDPRKLKEALCNIDNPVVMPSGVPIKKVRVFREEQTIQPIREDRAEKENNPDLVAWVKPGSTHHLCIFEWDEKGKTKRDAVFVTQLEAINRVKRQQQELVKRMKSVETKGLKRFEIRKLQAKPMREIAAEFPLIQRDASKLQGEDRQRIPRDAKFVMSLSKGEMVLLNIDETDMLYVYYSAASTTQQMTFYPHTAAKHQGRQHGKLTKYPDSLAKLNPRKVTVDPLGRIRWAND